MVVRNDHTGVFLGSPWLFWSTIVTIIEMFRSCLYCDLHCLYRVFPLGCHLKTLICVPLSAGGGNHIQAVWFQTPFLLNERYLKGKRMCIHDSSIGGLLLYIDHLCDRPPCGWNATMGPQAAGLGWDGVPWNWFHRSSRSSWHITFFLLQCQKECKPLNIVLRCGGIIAIQVIRNFWKHRCPAAVFASNMQIPRQPTTFTPVFFIVFVHLYVPVWKNTGLVCELNFTLLKSECSIRSHWVSHDQ